jgi:hypothetical protein
MTRKILSLFIAVAALSLFTVAAFGQARTAGRPVISEVSTEASSSQRVELSGLNDLLERARAAEAALILGTWQTTVSFEDGEIQVLFTFMPGRTPLEGTLIDTNSSLLTSPFPCSPDQGAWEKKGGLGTRTFTATHYAFCFEADKGNEFAGPVKVRDNITVNEQGTEFNGTQFIEVYDAGNQLLFTVTAKMHGVRVKAEAPPDSAAATAEPAEAKASVAARSLSMLRNRLRKNQ